VKRHAQRLFPALAVICTVVVTVHAGPDDIRFRSLSVEDGLSQSAVNCILQDRDGFIWLGTQDGLNRYDGYQFTTYRHNEHDPFSISESYVTCLLEQPVGTLWVGTYNGGLNRFDRNSGRFQHFLHDSASGSGPAGNIIMAVTGDRSGNLWLASWSAGLDRYDPAHDSWTHFSHDPADASSLSDNRVRNLLVDRDGVLWICTFRGIDRYDPVNRKFFHLRHDATDPSSLSDDVVISACQDVDGDLWFGTSDGTLNRFDRRQSRFVRYLNTEPGSSLAPHFQLEAVLQDGDGVIWAASRGGGVIRLDKQTGKTWSHRHQDDDRSSISSDYALALHRDERGSIWVGVDGGGVNNYDPYRFKFRHVRHIRGNSRSLSNALVRGLCEDREGDLWAGTATGCIDRVQVDPGVYVHYRTEAPGGKPGSAMVLTILEDRYGNIWAGTDGDGLNLFDRRAGAFRHVTLGQPTHERFAGDNIMALAEGSDGTLWVGTLGGGVQHFNSRTRQCTVIRHSGSTANQLSGNWIYALHEDRHGLLWIGTWGQGITTFDQKTGAYQVYRHDPTDPGSLSHNTVHAFHEDAQGAIWVGTMGGGLDRFDSATAAFEHFTEEDGLPNNVVYGILEDSAGNLWISTNKGISCFNPGARTFRNYGMSDGLQSLEFNQGAYCRGAGGRMAFGGINGINVFFPGRFSASAWVPQISITRAQVLDRDVPVPRDPRNPLTISYDEGLLALEFCVLDYTAPELNACRYMLEGLDKDWVEAGSRRYVSYAHLNGGEYLFRVQGRNSEGVWNREGAALRILVRPPFWETLWFRVLAFVLVLGTGFAFYHGRIERLEKEKAIAADFSRKLNESQERERQRIAGELHDGIGQNLLSIRNRLATFLLDPAGKKPEAGAIQEIAGAVQQTIDEVREVSADLHPHILDRLGLKRAIESMIRKCAGSSGIDMRTSIAEVDGLFPPPAGINIYRIIQEGISNIVRHSHASQCAVEVMRTQSHCRIMIEDDGCGFTPGPALPASTAGGGFGLPNMQERVRLLGGQLKIESAPGQGTTLRFLIPLDQEPPRG
jgi:signal transduction histidine kinase/ligand-binding sensor domain-containing protein